MEEVVPGLFVESSYAPYNLVLIRTARGGIMVDMPPNPMQAMSWIEQARAILGDLRYVVMTDAQRERQLATMLCDVPIVAAEATLRLMDVYDEERPRRDLLEDLAGRFPDGVEAFDNLRPHKPALAFEDTFTLYSGDRVLQFQVVDGAARGSLLLLLENEGVLIAGDTVVADDVPLMAETLDSKAWLNTMTSLAHRQDVHTVIPGRGTPTITLGDLEPQREFMRVMRRAARTLAHRGGPSLSLTQTAQELGQTFFNRQGQKAVKKIRAGLENLIAEIEAARAAEEAASVEEESGAQQ